MKIPHKNLINKDIEFNVSNICFLKLRTGFHTYLCQDDSTDKIQNEYMDAIEIFSDDKPCTCSNSSFIKFGSFQLESLHGCIG